MKSGSSPQKGGRKKRSKSLGGDEAIVPRTRRSSIAPTRSILKPSMNTDNVDNHTVIGVMEVALKDENDSNKENQSRRKSLLNRRVSFAATASVRTFETTPSPPSTPVQAGRSKTATSPRRSPRTPPRKVSNIATRTPPLNFNNPEDDSSDTESMDIIAEKTSEQVHKKSSLRESARNLDVTSSFSDDADDSGEVTMDMTEVIGYASTDGAPGISTPQKLASVRQVSPQSSPFLENLPGTSPGKQQRASVDQTMDMDLTVLLPHEDKLSKIQSQRVPLLPTKEPEAQDVTVDMDFTAVLQEEATQTLPVDMDMTQAGHIFAANHIEHSASISKVGTNLQETPAEEIDMDITRPLGVQVVSSKQTVEDMEFTQMIVSQNSFKHSPSTAKAQEMESKDVTEDMDITKPIYREIGPSSPINETSQPSNAKKILRKSLPASTSLHTPLRARRRGSLAADMLTGNQTHSPTTLGSPGAIKMLKQRKPVAGPDAFHQERTRVTLTMGGWKSDENGTTTGTDIRNRIKLLTPKQKKQPLASPEKVTSIKRKFEDKLAALKSPDSKRIRQFSPSKIGSAEQEPYENTTHISLDEFLKMISISFLDGLTTTRRRETILQLSNFLTEPILGDYVSAAVTTLPMLELFQFSCKELKQYISEGQDVVRRIDEETCNYNPLLFNEYMSAAPDLRAIMDGQFRLLKTHARFIAKGVWYEWRRKLMEGVNAILQKNKDALLADKRYIEDIKAGRFSSDSFDDLTNRHRQLQERIELSRARKRDVDASDKIELRDARDRLAQVKEELSHAKENLASFMSKTSSAENRLRKLSDDAVQLRSEIDQAQHIIDTHRATSDTEIIEMRRTERMLSRLFGCRIVSSNDGSLVMVLRNALRISITSDTVQLSFSQDTTNEAFLRYAQSRLDSMKGSSMDKIHTISKIWHIQDALRFEISLLRSIHPMLVEISNTQINVQSTVFNGLHLTKVSVALKIELEGIETSTNIWKAMDSQVQVVYGAVDGGQLSKDLVGRLGLGGVGVLRDGCREIMHRIVSTAV